MSNLVTGSRFARKLRQISWDFYEPNQARPPRRAGSSRQQGHRDDYLALLPRCFGNAAASTLAVLITDRRMAAVISVIALALVMLAQYFVEVVEVEAEVKVCTSCENLLRPGPYQASAWQFCPIIRRSSPNQFHHQSNLEPRG